MGDSNVLTISQGGSININNSDFSKLLYQRPTLNVDASGTYSLSTIRAVNIRGSANPANGAALILQATTLVSTQQVVFVNTSSRAITLQLDNGGTVGGQSVYLLTPGNINFTFDGTNLA